MLKIGIAGVGFMGMVHYLTYQKLRGAKVAAICDPDPEKRSGDWRGIQGNFGPPGERMDLSGVAAYESLDELIADESLDLIDITLPPALHADAACRALSAGKHVFCEKPMAMRPADCDRMQRAADKAERLLLVGHVLPYFPEYAWALKEVQSGKHGRLLGGSFKRVISDPAWLSHYWDAERIGGPMLDLHVHDAHLIRLLFGKPTAVTTCGRLREGLPEFWSTQFEYGPQASGVGPRRASEARSPKPEAVAVTATSGTINQQGRPFQHAFELHLERATLVFDFAVIGDEAGYLCPPTVLTEGGKAKRPHLAGGDPMDAFAGELKEVLRCVRAGEQSPVLGAELARDAISICQAQSRSLQTGKRVRV
ncbi:Gfo/Idh/MocA family oxidoreductase [Botrimarina sp.]|uniref:Gfo/Idh/MocA family protein n=1 Tax=Botrimarina sp. TaxID=2795802 RepID=UPI0032EDF39D